VHVTLVSGIDPSVPAAGGTRSYVLELAKRLPEHDVSVSLVSRGTGRISLPGVDIMPISSRPGSAAFLAKLLASAPGLPIPPRSIVHAQRPDDLAAFVLAKRGNPTVCTLHGIPALAVPRRKGKVVGVGYRMLETVGLRRADRIIAVTQGVAEWYSRHRPSTAARTVVIPIGVDTTGFRPQDRETARKRFGVRARYACLYAGRLSPEKRIDVLVRAARDLRDAEIIVAGTGPAGPPLKDMARGVPVRFLGAVSREDMPLLINAADVVVLPSEYEGLPTLALEALACGKPVVATPVGAIPDLVVEGKTGWLLLDVGELARVLNRALPQAEDLKEACLVAIREYAWDAVIERILRVYRELLDAT